MIAIIKSNTTPQQREELMVWLRSRKATVSAAEGADHTFLTISEDAAVDGNVLAAFPIVEAVKEESEPYRKADRNSHPADTVVRVGEEKLGGGHFCLIAGPCCIESEEQIFAVAEKVKASGAALLRGGAFKPRTSPYDFQGLGKEGLRLLRLAGQRRGLPVVSEIMNLEQLPLFEDVDVLQVGARNMQNFPLLRELGHSRKPVLLKRGPANTLRELLLSAEYLLAGGNENVILCERGIRSFETDTRYTPDIGSVPLLHELTHLPVIADPSHSTGRAGLVPSLALAATAAGADGLMIEVHPDPRNALCDGAQALTPAEFDAVAKKALQIRRVME